MKWSHPKLQPYEKKSRYICEKFGLLIVRHTPTQWWLYQHGKPIGYGPTLQAAKDKAAEFADLTGE